VLENHLQEHAEILAVVHSRLGFSQDAALFSPKAAR